VEGADVSLGQLFVLGDRVVAVEDLGGFFWPKVRRGSSGIVIGYGPRVTVLVHFAGRHTMCVQPESVIVLDPAGFYDPLWAWLSSLVTSGFVRQGALDALHRVTTVDAAFADLTGAGYEAHLEPWDAFWGMRYASVRDPDGNPVDLFAPLPS